MKIIGEKTNYFDNRKRAIQMKKEEKECPMV